MAAHPLQDVRRYDGGLKPVVLLVATATRWLGTARIPRPLAAAGFDVVLLTPRGSLAEKSTQVRRIGHIPDDATPMQWLQAFATIVRATSPRLVVPCDDMAFRLLQMVVLNPPEELRPEVQLQLAHLIRESLGDPAHYRTSVEKTALAAAAAALGVRVPAHAVIADLPAAHAFAATHGYPLVLKRDHSTAGDGVEIVERSDQLAPSFAALTAGGQPDATGAAARLLIQVQIPGTIHYENTAAWNGARIGGFAVERVEYSHVKGPATVIRCYHSAQIRDFSTKLVQGFGMTGLFATEYMIHRDTGDAYLLEINRRLTPGMHVGARVNVDLCALLYAAVQGTPATTRSDPDVGHEWVNVHFPQEWLRDPASAYLRDYPVDVPWEDAGLIEAMLAMRHE
jgi:predicted ATP-grasp superfamily ATP-dependent carboligase